MTLLNSTPNVVLLSCENLPRTSWLVMLVFPAHAPLLFVHLCILELRAHDHESARRASVRRGMCVHILQLKMMRSQEVEVKVIIMLSYRYSFPSLADGPNCTIAFSAPDQSFKSSKGRRVNNGADNLSFPMYSASCPVMGTLMSQEWPPAEQEEVTHLWCYRR